MTLSVVYKALVILQKKMFPDRTLSVSKVEARHS